MAIFKMHTNKVLKLVFTLFTLICGVNLSGQQVEETIKKVVLDPGHGGHDPGTSGRFFKEKDVVLGVAFRLGQLIETNFPEIEVIYTRKKDVFVELKDRSMIANNANADLFISIHANSVDNTLVRGAETFVLGTRKSNDNFEVALKENKVITLEDNYEAKYEEFNPDSPESHIMFHLMQNAYLEQSLKLAEFIQDEMIKGPVIVNRGVKQDAFVVLWYTTVPSVLVELGFLSNIEEEMILGDTDQQDIIAGRLFTAFKKYKENFEASY